MKKFFSKINSLILSFKIQHLVFLIFLSQIFIGVSILLAGSWVKFGLDWIGSAVVDTGFSLNDIKEAIASK